jgi:hypothetical protein
MANIASYPKLDLWDCTLNFITNLDTECSQTVAAGELDEFVAKWHIQLPMCSTSIGLLAPNLLHDESLPRVFEAK